MSTPFNAHTFRSSTKKDGTESSIIRYPPRKRHLQLILGDLFETLGSRTGVVVKACKKKNSNEWRGGGGRGHRSQKLDVRSAMQRDGEG